MLWARHLLSPEDLRKRKERLRNLRLEKLERQGKKARSKRSQRPPRYRYGVRTDSKPIAGARWTCDADPGTPEEGSLHMCRVWICDGVVP